MGAPLFDQEELELWVLNDEALYSDYLTYCDDRDLDNEDEQPLADFTREYADEIGLFIRGELNGKEN